MGVMKRQRKRLTSHDLFNCGQVNSCHPQTAGEGMSQVVKAKSTSPAHLTALVKVFAICRYPNTDSVGSQDANILRRFNVAVNVSVMGTLRAS